VNDLWREVVEVQQQEVALRPAAALVWISMVMARETTSRDARSFAFGA